MSGAERIHVSVIDGTCDPESKKYQNYCQTNS